MASKLLPLILNWVFVKERGSQQNIIIHQTRHLNSITLHTDKNGMYSAKVGALALVLEKSATDLNAKTLLA